MSRHTGAAIVPLALLLAAHPRFLTLGVLTRAPTAGERSRFRAYLVPALGREPGGDFAQLRGTRRRC